MASTTDPGIVVPAPAKLNISLAVGPLQPDGYHLIDSLMAPLELADEVMLAATDGGLTLNAVGPTADQTPTDASNLAWRAAELLAREARCEPSVAITLVKNIPVGGGLAGGSTDAAAVLRGLNSLWRLNWPTDRLIELAARLGSDVPFCVSAGPAWVSGRGQIVRPVDRPLPPLWVLLILPGLFVSTGKVYARLDAIRAEHREKPDRKHRLAGLEFYNQLEEPALAVCPALAKVFDILEHQTGVPRLLVAGSGSTLFAPFDSYAEAVEWKERIDTGVTPAGRKIQSPVTCMTVVSAVSGGASSCRSPDRDDRAGRSCSGDQGVSNGRQRSENQTGGPAE